MEYGGEVGHGLPLPREDAIGAGRDRAKARSVPPRSTRRPVGARDEGPMLKCSVARPRAPSRFDGARWQPVPIPTEARRSAPDDPVPA